MARSKSDVWYESMANELGCTSSEVKRAVMSFFSVVIMEAGSLPVDTDRKIFTKAKFDEFVKVHNIPYIGRIGPVYSRYLKWRSNEAEGLPKAKRSDYRVGFSRSEIENIAEEILSGGTPQIKKKKNSELFDRVWMVGKEGKKSARQVIPKEDKKNGI